MAYMKEIERLPDAELREKAEYYRRRALQGDLKARGCAHRFEVELRRRVGVPLSDYLRWDLRPLARLERSPSSVPRQGLFIAVVAGLLFAVGVVFLALFLDVG